MSKLLAVVVLLAGLVSFVRAQEGGYADQASVAQGDSIRFFISTSSNRFKLTVSRIGVTTQTVATVNSLAGGVQAVPDSSYRYGCNWRITYAMKVPETWTSGLYQAQFPVTGGTQQIVFVVRQRVPGSLCSTALKIPINTLQAYNSFGGKSLYDFNSTEGRQSYKVSFNRPYNDLGNLATTIKLIQWLEAQSIPSEYLVNGDIEANPSVLAPYSILFLVWHDEYWTKNERDAVENFIAGGGRLMCLGGNTCWWQARMENDGRTLVCYRSASIDPMRGTDNSQVTVNWYQSPVNRPENTMLGASFRNGGYVNSQGFLPQTAGYGGYAAFNSHHWIYAGTGLHEGSVYGQQIPIAGYESDGALYSWNSGFPVPTGADQTPLNFRIIATSPAVSSSGKMNHATAGLFFTAGGGAVFNAASVYWANGLATDAAVRAVTQNVYKRFSENRFPPDITAWSPFRLRGDSVNHEWTLLNYRDTSVDAGSALGFSVTANDPRSEPLSYRWMVNGAPLGDGTTFTFLPNGFTPVQSVVTALVMNGHDTASISWNVRVKFSPPEISPSPFLPVAGGADIPRMTTLTWSSLPLASGYRVTVTDDSLFGTTLRDTTVTDTTFGIGVLRFGRSYFWKVAAANPGGTGPWSPVFRFTTLLPPTPVQSGPGNGSSVKHRRVSLAWGNLRESLQYHVQVAIDTGFTAPAYELTGTDTAVTFTGLRDTSIYFWRVRALDGDAAGNWSTVFSVHTTRNFSIHSSTGSHGTIVPSGEIMAAEGEIDTFVIIPEPHHHIDSVFIDGVYSGAPSQVVFDSILGTRTVHATFTIDSVLLNASAGPGGSIRPSGAVTVAFGDSALFIASPLTGYHPAGMAVDGVTVTAETTLTLRNVTASGSVFASFERDNENRSLRSGLWRDSSLWSYGRPPNSSDSALIVAGHVVTLDSNAAAGALTIAASGVMTFLRSGVSVVVHGIDGRSGTLLNAGNIAAGPGLMDTLLITGSFLSTGAQSTNICVRMRGDGFRELLSTGRIGTLLLDRAELRLHARSPLTITEALRLSGGKLYLEEYDCALDANAGADTGSSSSYVVTNGTGRLIRHAGTDGAAFPIGIDTSFAPVTLATVHGSGKFRAGIIPGVVPASRDDEGALQWTVDLAADSVDELPVRMHCTWDVKDEGPGFIRTAAISWRHNGLTWIQEGLIEGLTVAGIAGGVPIRYTAFVDDIYEFGHFIIGAPGTLPLQLIEFSAVSGEAGGVHVRWSTSSEENSYGFYVERSDDSGRSFHAVSGLIPAAGTSIDRHDYSWIDRIPLHGSKAFYRLKLVDSTGGKVFSDPIEFVHLLGSMPAEPLVFGLRQNYPNPFNPSTVIRYSLEAGAATRLSLFNILGQEVGRIVDEFQPAGTYTKTWQPASLPSGIYFCRLTSGGRTSIIRLVLQK